MLIILFVLFMGAAVASLIFGVKMKSWILCAVASIFFLVLAFSAFQIEVPSGGVTLTFQDITFVLISWAGAIISLIFTLYGMASYLKTRKKQITGG